MTKKKAETVERPRETMPELVSAGYEDAQDRAHVAMALPFDPAEFAAGRALADRLAEIDEVEVLHRLQRVDTRTTAAAHYERRINELEDPAEAEEEA